LAKNVEELFFAGDQESLKLEFNSDVLKFIRSIRDEVHRFGITFHRQIRSKGTFKNELASIKGVGNKTVQKLIEHFGSVKQVRHASPKEIETIVGSRLSQSIQEWQRS